MSADNVRFILNELLPEEDEEYCPTCGNGDRVSEGKYFLCPECDAEWNDVWDE